MTTLASSKREVHAVLKCGSCGTAYNRDMMANHKSYPYFYMHIITYIIMKALRKILNTAFLQTFCMTTP